jgi:protein-disulfide isomerase
MMSDEIPPKRELPKTMAMDGFSMPGVTPAPIAASGWGPPNPSAPGWGPSPNSPAPPFQGPPHQTAPQGSGWNQQLGQAPTMFANHPAPMPFGAPPAAPHVAPQSGSSSKGLWIGLIAGAGCLLAIPVGLVMMGALGALFWAGESESTELETITPTVAAPIAQASIPANLPPDPYAGQRFQVPVPPGTPIRGANTALVTIVEFGDFECPFCRRSSATMQQLIAERPGQVRVVWRHNPLAFHPNARVAAQASLEAYTQGGDAMFWRMHDILYEEETYGLSELGVRLAARRVGLDMSRFDIAMDSGRHQAAVQRDQDLAAQLAVSGTPAFFVNGREVRGAQPIESFRTIVDEEIRYAQSLVNAGVRPENVYTTLIRNGQTSRAPSAYPY